MLQSFLVNFSFRRQVFYYFRSFIIFDLLFFSFGIKPLNQFIYQFTLKKISSRNFVCIITCCRGVNCSSKCALFRIINWIHVIGPFVWYYKDCSVPYYSVFHFVFNFRLFFVKIQFSLFFLCTKKLFTKWYQGSSLLAIIVNIIMANWFSCFSCDQSNSGIEQYLQYKKKCVLLYKFDLYK